MYILQYIASICSAPYPGTLTPPSCADQLLVPDPGTLTPPSCADQLLRSEMPVDPIWHLCSRNNQTVMIITKHPRGLRFQAMSFSEFARWWVCLLDRNFYFWMEIDRPEDPCSATWRMTFRNICLLRNESLTMVSQGTAIVHGWTIIAHLSLHTRTHARARAHAHTRGSR